MPGPQCGRKFNAGSTYRISFVAGGVTGVSWNAKIMPLRALGNGGGSTVPYDELLKTVRILLVMLAMAFALIAFPQIALWLPNALQ